MTKKIAIIVFMLMVQRLPAQDPVQWSFSSTKTGDNEYTITLKASLQPGWHLYSQKQPAHAIALPTEIKFNKNPLFELKDPTKEKGNLIKYKDKILGVEAWQYAGNLEFVQRIRLKGKASTNATGSVTYQVCTDERCLPPKLIYFNVPVLPAS